MAAGRSGTITKMLFAGRDFKREENIMGQLDSLIYYEERKKAEERQKAVEKEKRKIKEYAANRYNPTLPYCGTGHIELLFDGEKLYLFATTANSSVRFEYKAVSGLPDASGNFDYGSHRQTRADVGPIPEGKYWINPDEFWENAWYKQGSYSSWGNYRITIHPFVDTNTHGSVGSATGLFVPRGGFFIHGGKTPGSKGCIDLTAVMDKFFKDVQNLIGDNDECQIQLSVKYKK